MANRGTVTVHVLIVDDQAAFRRAAARVLARLPRFEVVGEADTGEASIDLARSLRPDLVLMDIHLPGIDGTTATRRILAEAALSCKLPLVFLLSTYEAADYASQTVACGASAYLAKAEFGPRVLEAAWLAANAEAPEIA
jgi:DNA-binding NarL/FixJ family response regulator